MPLQKVLTGYRVTLPQKFREQNRVSVGDWIDVEETDTKIVVTPVDVKVKEKRT